jgi:hypothetical protein
MRRTATGRSAALHIGASGEEVNLTIRQLIFLVWVRDGR